jgi:hypothetical protein
MDHVEVFKFICMCGIVYSSHFSYTSSMRRFASCFNYGGFALAIGVGAKDDGKAVWSVQMARECCLMLLGTCLYNVLVEFWFGFIYMRSASNFSIFTSEASHIHLGTAPWCWLVLAIVMWRCSITPLYNTMRHCGASGSLALYIVLFFGVPIREHLTQQCLQWSEMYHRIAFYMPFYAVGVALDESQLASAGVLYSSFAMTLCVVACFVFVASPDCGSNACVFAGFVVDTVGMLPSTYPECAKEALGEIIFQLSFSLALILSLLHTMRLWCTSWLGSPSTILPRIIELFAGLGSRSMNAYFLLFFLTLFKELDTTEHASMFQIVGIEVLSWLSAISFTAFCCSQPVEILMGQVLRPTWICRLLEMLPRMQPAMKAGHHQAN